MTIKLVHVHQLVESLYVMGSNVNPCWLLLATSIRPKKKLFGCTPPTNPMFEAYPNLFFFFILNQNITKLTKKRQNNVEKKFLNIVSDTGRPAIKSLHVLNVEVQLIKYK